jgi:hypothetical protein
MSSQDPKFQEVLLEMGFNSLATLSSSTGVSDEILLVSQDVNTQNIIPSTNNNSAPSTDTGYITDAL